MSHLVAKLSLAAALLGVGGVFGAALTADSDPSTAAPTAVVKRPPVEIRTVVKRRTVHVYRKPKKHKPAVRPATPASAPPPAPAPAPAPAVAPASVRASEPVQPLETRTSGSSGGREREESDDRSEHEGGEHEGGDD